MNEPKVLVLDIETAPNLVWAWALHDQNIGLEQIERPGYILCYAAKWVGTKEVLFDSIFNYKLFKKNPYTDKMIAISAHKLISQADIIVGQNSDNFDLKWLNTAFIMNGLEPIPPHKKVDTLKISRNNFRFLSNKLDYVSTALGFGGKEKHEGFALWKKCILGDPTSWKKMESYNKTDVIKTEQVYLKMRPYTKNHPNMAIYVDDDNRKCPACLSVNINRRGYEKVRNAKFVRYQCKDCGHWCRGNVNVAEKKEKVISI